MLTSHEDFTTLMYHGGADIGRPGAVFAYLKRQLPDAVVEEIQRMTLTEDGCHAVFDVPSKRVKVRARLSRRLSHLAPLPSCLVVYGVPSRRARVHARLYCQALASGTFARLLCSLMGSA